VLSGFPTLLGLFLAGRAKNNPNKEESTMLPQAITAFAYALEKKKRDSQ
jgi:hypothetical protein